MTFSYKLSIKLGFWFRKERSIPLKVDRFGKGVNVSHYENVDANGNLGKLGMIRMQQ